MKIWQILDFHFRVTSPPSFFSYCLVYTFPTKGCIAYYIFTAYTTFRSRLEAFCNVNNRLHEFAQFPPVPFPFSLSQGFKSSLEYNKWVHMKDLIVTQVLMLLGLK